MAPDVFRRGRIVYSAPMFETMWGEHPPGGLPRLMAHYIGKIGVVCGFGRRLPPLPGSVLSWWNPHAPIRNVNLSHDIGKLQWYHGLRTLNPKMALLGPSMAWIYECTLAQYALEECRIARDIINPTLIFTAEHDTFVKSSGQEAFCAAAPNCRRVLVKGAYHEVRIE